MRRYVTIQGKGCCNRTATRATVINSTMQSPWGAYVLSIACVRWVLVFQRSSKYYLGRIKALQSLLNQYHSPIARWIDNMNQDKMTESFSLKELIESLGTGKLVFEANDSRSDH